MSTIVKTWSNGSVSIAVEAGKDSMNQENNGPHVHVYKRDRRTKSRIPGKNKDLDAKDYDIAEKLFYDNYREIDFYCNQVREGKYDDR